MTRKDAVRALCEMRRTLADIGEMPDIDYGNVNCARSCINTLIGEITVADYQAHLAAEATS